MKASTLRAFMIVGSIFLYANEFKKILHELHQKKKNQLHVDGICIIILKTAEKVLSSHQSAGSRSISLVSMLILQCGWESTTKSGDMVNIYLADIIMLNIMDYFPLVKCFSFVFVSMKRLVG